MAESNAHSLHGSTNDSSSIPDSSLDPGPAYDEEGSLILAKSFKASASDALDGIAGQRLADAFAIWECYSDQQAGNSPLLLRFEACDLVAAIGEDGLLSLWKGAVDTSSKVRSAADGFPSGSCESDELCLAWVAIRSLSKTMGQQASSIHLDGKQCLLIRLEETRIRIGVRCRSLRIAIENQPG